MKKRYINASILIISVFLIALFSLNMGQNYSKHHHSQVGHSDTHQLLHEELRLTSDQENQLMQIEKKYTKQKLYLEETMKVANMELANAINKDKSYSDEVQKSVEKIHHAMGGIQKATLEHLFEMRPILNDQQNEKLLELITNGLYANIKEGN